MSDTNFQVLRFVFHERHTNIWALTICERAVTFLWEQPPRQSCCSCRRSSGVKHSCRGGELKLNSHCEEERTCTGVVHACALPPPGPPPPPSSVCSSAVGGAWVDSIAASLFENSWLSWPPVEHLELINHALNVVRVDVEDEEHLRETAGTWGLWTCDGGGGDWKCPTLTKHLQVFCLHSEHVVVEVNARHHTLINQFFLTRPVWAYSV